MELLLIFGIVWTLYGVIGLFKKNRSWQYGLSNIILGVPYVILYYLSQYFNWSSIIVFILMIVCSIPSLMYTMYLGSKQ